MRRAFCDSGQVIALSKICYIFPHMKDFLKWTMFGSMFAVPFALLIVSSTMFFPYITGKNFTFRILVEIGFASWTLLALINQDYRPRWSWITLSIASLVGVMFLAAIFGEYPAKSFWSNFERMEGWVTLVHFFMYFLVLGAILKTEQLWNYFLNTALVAATIMSLYALTQISGLAEVSQGAAWRVDARLGNSSYLGVYMLFHMFIAAWMFAKTKSANSAITSCASTRKGASTRASCSTWTAWAPTCATPTRRRSA